MNSIFQLTICRNLCTCFATLMLSLDSVSTVYTADFLMKPLRKNELRNLWQHVWRRQYLQKCLRRKGELGRQRTWWLGVLSLMTPQMSGSLLIKRFASRDLELISSFKVQFQANHLDFIVHHYNAC